MRIRLTEAQAWETLARFFGSMTPQSDFDEYRGLCFQVNKLLEAGYIPEGTRVSIFKMLSREMDRTEKFYLWHLDLTGAKARAAFCWKQVARLKRKQG